MFDELQNRFSKIFRNIKGQGKISDKNISDAIREIRIALLESDVNFKVVSSFVNKVKEKAIGAEVYDSVTPGQQFIKIVLDELILFLSSDEMKLNINKSGITKIVMAGLQGSGKTTTSAKIASFLKREYKKKPILIGADLQRLAAQDQLKVLADQIEVDVFFGNSKDVKQTVKNGMKFAQDNGNDVVIIDTAGRLHIDELLIQELEDIIDLVKPDEILYIVDGMTGQDAINATKVFSERCSLTGSIITKMDGNSGGGVALSIKEVSNCPIKLMSYGEKVNQLEIFDPERISRRILGLGDIVGLVEEAQKSFDNEESRKVAEKLINNEFNFDDFLKQIKQFNNIGSLSEMMKFMPGMKKIDLNVSKDQLKWTEAII